MSKWKLRLELVVFCIVLMVGWRCGHKRPVAASADVDRGSSIGLSIITTSDLHLGYIGQPYEAILKARGGSGSYTWHVASRQLPPGLSVEAATGKIKGSPAITASGRYELTAYVDDASRSHHGTATKTFNLTIAGLRLDNYSGLVDVTCAGGPQAHFYIQKMGNRWHLCTPAGHAFWMNGVQDTSAAMDNTVDYQGIVPGDLITSKYATGFTTNATLNGALQAARRMQAWGFNANAEYAWVWMLPVATHSSWGTSDSTIPLKLPFVGFLDTSSYAVTNLNNWANGPVKDIVNGIKSTVYTGYRSRSLDFWDANYAQWFQNALINDYWTHQAYAGPHNDYLIGFNVDDTDRLQGFGAGPDFPTTNNGLVAAGYQQPHLGWMVLVTAPTQSSNSSLGVTYTDTTVYSKQELSNWLSGRYGANIASLNAAWGSRYTAFGSSGGFGVGTGLLDEDGTCPSKGSGQACWVPSDAFGLSGATATVKQDLDDFLLHHAQKYFSVIKAALQAQAPGILYLGPTVLGTWGAPPRRQILEAAAQYVDVIPLGTVPPDCTNCTDIQQRIDFVAEYGGDKPWINWEGNPANADSYMSPYASSSDQFQTQAARGQYYQETMVPQLLSAQDTATGTYHIVGFKWWELYDSRKDQMNWGLLTRRDDPYDGVSAATAPGADSWGYPTGCLPIYDCEQASYGNFIDAVVSANLSALRRMVTGP